MTSTAHPTTRQWDELGLGLVDAPTRAALEQHRASCPRCAALERERAEHADRFRNVVFPRTIDAVARRRQRRWWWPLLVVPVVATAAFVLLPRTVTPPTPALGVKGGGPTLQLFVRRSGHVSAVADGAVLRPGDALRFRVAPSGRRFLLVTSVDGAGKANVYFPFGGDRSAAVPRDRAQELPGSIVLDDAAGPERVFAIASDHPIDASAVRATLERVGRQGAAAIRDRRSLELDDTLQDSVLFEKQVHR